VSASTRHFIRHYVEMVIAMFVGMAVLGAPAGLVVDYDVPAQMLAAMAVTMTVPMAGWMRFRGHGWQPTAEMSAAMIMPTLGVLGLLAADLLTDLGTLLVIEHAAMFAGMLVAMLLRRDEYTGHAHHAVTA
jgi:hypothetical protein